MQKGCGDGICCPEPLTRLDVGICGLSYHQVSRFLVCMGF